MAILVQGRWQRALRQAPDVCSAFAAVLADGRRAEVVVTVSELRGRRAQARPDGWRLFGALRVEAERAECSRCAGCTPAVAESADRKGPLWHAPAPQWHHFA